MASPSVKPTDKIPPAPAKTGLGDSTPLPPATLHVSTIRWPKTQKIHRIHLDLYRPDVFNPGVKGNARFSPIKTTSGVPIPSIYGGTTFDCAAMETVFHDVPFAAGLKTMDRHKLSSQLHSVLALDCDLILADLSSVALRKLGILRSQLIDTEKDSYPLTRQWAEAIYARHPDIQGLCWTSRQDDRAQALMLFGDRVSSGSLHHQGHSRSLLQDSAAYLELLALADRIGLQLITGKS